MRDRLIELIDDFIHTEDVKWWYSEELDEKLAEHLIANGVIVPPYKVGDMVYVPNKNTCSVDEYQVFAIHNYGGLWGCSATRTDDKITYTFDESIVGDNVFLAKEEAEAALEGGAE